MDDTSPEMAQKMREMLQERTPQERLEMGFSMNATSRFLVKRAILERNPNISPAALRQEMFLKYYEDDFSPEEREKILAHLGRISEA